MLKRRLEVYIFIKTSKRIIGMILKYFFFYRSALDTMNDNCCTLCMVEIPAHVTCFELLRFISPVADKIIESKIIRDDSPNQYFVVIKFKSSVSFLCIYLYIFAFRQMRLVSTKSTMVFDSIRWKMLIARCCLWRRLKMQGFN